MACLRPTFFLLLLAAMALLAGCTQSEPAYGREQVRALQSRKRQVWAVAPAINLSGEKGVDPILQADLLYQQVQQVQGVTALPVNRVAEVYTALRLEKITTSQQASLVCDLLGCDGLLIPVVTIFDPYNPPKMGASLQLFLKPAGYSRPADVDPRELIRRTGSKDPAAAAEVAQVVGMFDSANGTVRDRLSAYAAGRHDPVGPLGAKEYLVSMDRYCGFVYCELIEQLIASAKLKG